MSQWRICLGGISNVGGDVLLTKTAHTKSTKDTWKQVQMFTQCQKKNQPAFLEDSLSTFDDH